MSKKFDTKVERTEIAIFYKLLKVKVDNMKNNIKKHRTDLRLLQEELAQKCGVSRQTINAVENGKYDPTLRLAFKLAEVLNSTVDELFVYKEK